MTDKTLTNNEIIKAFECCIKANGNCENCEIENFCKEHDSEINKETLDLINRLQAENERKDKVFIETLKRCALKDEIITEKTAEIERLESEVETTRNYIIDCLRGLDDFLDNLLKELVGEDNAK